MPRLRTKPDWMIRAEQEAQALSEHMQIPYEDCWRFLNPDDEPDTVSFIKKYLRTPEQKAILDANDWSIEDILNFRIEGGQPAVVYEMFERWNERLGRRVFHS